MKKKQELDLLEITAKEEAQRNKTFNGMTAKEWTASSRSVWNDLSSTRKKKHLAHGATYPEKLCDRIIKMYSKESDIILDPFLGTGTTAISAIKNNRHVIGIELNEEFYEIAKLEIASENSIFDQDCNYKIVLGDCAEKILEIEDGTIQLTFTSPPYADLIHKITEDRTHRHKKSAFVIDNNATTKIYSDHKQDLGNMALDEYLIKVDEIMSTIYRKTRKGGYNIWVVKDFRDVKHNLPYIDLHSAIANSGIKAGFKYQDLIIWDQNEQRRLVLLGYPSIFYVNQNHSFIVVLRKN